VRFEWDDEKAVANLEKHGVSFGEATEVFYDPNALEGFDAEHSAEENRFFIIGLSSRRLLYVVYAERADDMVRIISARRAVNREQELYGQATY
ncbi:MAG TPA: BrnT family toxin, partial [Pyrinomonadaceae bacterium]|nr:BrnT family toxin [Pyrinomonadaceae bacterium]